MTTIVLKAAKGRYLKYQERIREYCLSSLDEAPCGQVVACPKARLCLDIS